MEEWVRETSIAVGGVVGLLLVLTLYTGTWPPLVVVESGSMMHPAEAGYGHLGTIDPGDLVLVKDLDEPGEVELFVDGARDRYGRSGDVIVFHPDGDRRRTPIIHRAMTYVTVEGGECTYVGADGAPRSCAGGFGDDARTFGLEPGYRPDHSGFITLGDNNAQADQAAGVDPVRVDWVAGKARGEVPWIGLLKLAFGGRVNQPTAPDDWVRVGNALAPQDLWVMLVVTLAAIFALPVGVESGLRRWRGAQGSSGDRDEGPPRPPP